MLDILSSQPRITTLVPFEFIDLLGALGLSPMSGKRQKLPTKRGRASEDPTPNYDVTRFVNEVPPIGSAPFVRTVLSLRKRVSTTLMIFSVRRLWLRDGGHFANHLIQRRWVWCKNSTPIFPPTSSRKFE